jgi:ribosomal protein S18 acetylase RimI-like enzyme
MQIRPAREEDIPAIGRVHVDAWRSTYVGIVPDEFLANLSYSKQEERQRQYLAKPETIFLVADVPGAGSIGFLTGGPERGGDPFYRGELYALYLLQQYRRQGIGRALVRQWATAMRAVGIDSALVWAISANQIAIDFYQRLGARPLRPGEVTIAAITYPETALAWEDLGLI